MNTPHTEWPAAALSFMAIENPSEQDILGFLDSCTPYRERDEAISRRNIAFRLTGKTTGKLHVLPADPHPEPDYSVWSPGNNSTLCA